MSPELTLTYIIGIFCVLITLSVGIFTFFKASKKIAGATYFLLTFSISVYYISHMVGINAPSQVTAWFAFMFNMVNIFIICFNLHFNYEVYGKKFLYRKIMLAVSYAVGLGLFGFYLAFPFTFMQLPVHKLYLPYYYVPGSLYWVMRLYFLLLSVYMAADLIYVYRASDYTEKNRIKYMFAAVIYAYTLGSTALFLLYNIPVDPIYSMFFGLYTLPLAYSFLKYDPLDIHLVAKNALIYSASVITVSIIIIIINSASALVVAIYPTFPEWLIPLLSGCAAVAVGSFVWNKIQEVDKLKYEFITVVTHKFRTPLTYIKWSIDTLSGDTQQENREHAVRMIKTASTHLNELTDLLISLEQTEGSEYVYTFTSEDITPLITKVIEGETDRLQEKNIRIESALSSQSLRVFVDKRRLEFALQIILENAITYTPKNGTIKISITSEKEKVLVAIQDNGIGISKEELPYIFTKFYRGHDARVTDTEGVGIGLYIAKKIVNKQDGDIKVTSAGTGKGSTFSISLPLQK